MEHSEKEGIANLLCPKKSMIFRPFESGSQAATTHLTKSTQNGSIEEGGLKGPKKGDFSGQMNFAIPSKEKRLFFGAQVKAVWPEEFPAGRMIDEDMRHVTLAFIGQAAFSDFEKQLLTTPLPAFSMGVGGFGSSLVFLPKDHPRVVALEITWLEDPHLLYVYQKELFTWLEKMGYPVRRNTFSPHITIARAPFEKEKWQESFEPVPLYLSAVHLYESIGHLNYRSLWKHSLIEPFTEVEHTADIAFTVRGISIQQLCANAQLALFFKFPPLTQFYTPAIVETLDAIVIELNRMIALADELQGCPFKAVSFHGTIVKHGSILTWEMIVDV